MKAVLFCGGLGLRMGDSPTRAPKPMIPVGGRPILWHIMSYYETHGVNEFVLCLGYKADAIKEYFLNYNEALTNDFVLSDGGKRIDLLQRDIENWSVTFVNTDLHTSVGQRLKRVQRYLGDDDIFLATYGDGLTDAPLTEMIETLKRGDSIGLFLAARPTHSFHVVTFDESHVVSSIEDITRMDVWVNAGFFVFRREFFDYIGEGEDLLDEPFRRLIAERKLTAFPYEGFWAPMDTLKDKHLLDSLVESGQAPWQVPARDGDRASGPGGPTTHPRG